MADLFDPSSSSSPSAPPPPPPHNNFTLESDDISSLLHTLLHSSSQPSTPCIPPHLNSHHFQHQQAGSAAFSHQPGLNFQFDRPYNAFSGSIGEVDCESEELEEAPVNLSQEKTSSKRSRAAEVHNLSEKRRRQRINEKMKALQKLIPNSNKTDKASMLDEAIEYLKQLQLQVQMLTLRNGSSLHPFYLPGISQAVQQSQVGPLLDETSIGRGVGSFSGNQEASMQAMFDLSGKPASEYKLLKPPRMSETGKTGPTFCMEPSATNEHCSSFNASLPSKVLCKDPALPQLQLDMIHDQSSSSGVSS